MVSSCGPVIGKVLLKDKEVDAQPQYVATHKVAWPEPSVNRQSEQTALLTGWPHWTKGYKTTKGTPVAPEAEGKSICKRLGIVQRCFFLPKTSTVKLMLALLRGDAPPGSSTRSIGGSVVEFSPATREARVRFPANAQSEF